MKADFSETFELQQRMTSLADALAAMSGDVALARHVILYDSDRRKRALAIVAAPLLAAGSSSASADTEARSSPVYEAAMKKLGGELVAAEKVLTDWDARKIQWETARSLLSLSKATMTNL